MRRRDLWSWPFVNQMLIAMMGKVLDSDNNTDDSGSDNDID